MTLYLTLTVLLLTMCVSKSCSQRFDRRRQGLRSIPSYLPSEVNSIFLDYNLITYIPAGLFQTSSSLVELHVSFNNITDIETEAFKDLVRLQVLNLKSNQLTELRDGMFSHLETLRNLYLQYNQIKSIETGALDLPRLEVLYLNNNRLKELKASEFDMLFSLTHVRLHGNQLTTLESRVFSQKMKLNVSLSDPHSFRDQDNPWQCDSRLCWLKQWEQAARIQWVFIGDGPASPKCAEVHQDWDTWQCDGEVLTLIISVNYWEGDHHEVTGDIGTKVVLCKE